MGQHPLPLDRRYQAALQDIQRRLRTVEMRTMGIDSGFPLMALAAQIDPAYSSGDPKVFLNGAATLTGPYQHLASYTPAANDLVLAVPVVALQTYVIVGKLA
ncbi:MAG: hypothetical protein JWO67_3809 [Streptosporangiaceae bacterium]|nr:hypothetical protein [Streptosporangiaceae bacterium]